MTHANRNQSEQIIQEVSREVKRFIEDDINPAAHDRHQQRMPIPKTSFLKAAELGLIAYKFPTELGGRGKDNLDWGRLLEEVGYLCDDNSFPMLLSYYTGVAEDIYNIGSQKLIEAYVKPMLKGEKLGVFAYSEDADHFSFQSTARKVKDGYILNGIVQDKT